jgi:3-ketosteroid 9alpha-monooxygenase subunit A
VARTQEYDLGPHTFPRGWFMVADADEVTRTPKALRYFGQDLVIYRGESGRVVLMDAYCPHMGTHLAKNTTSFVIQDNTHVEGDNIRCPYHAWRFGPDGVCNQIPYFNGPIPKAARIRTWKAVEKYGVIFTWHDPEGGEPDFELPVIAEWDDPAWVQWKMDHLGQVPIHPVEILDNMADMGHLGPTHGAPALYFRNEFRDHVVYQYQGGTHRFLEPGAMLETETWYTGPGVLLSRYMDSQSLMIITHTPVEDGLVQAWTALLVRSSNAPPTEQDISTARAYQAESTRAFAQDFEIWTNKAPCFQVLQIPADGPYNKVRAWYKQFYHPRALAKTMQEQVNGSHTIRGFPDARVSAA